MRALLSTIGSRGDVQPLVALALALESLGQEVLLCVPPDFREWIEGLGLTAVSIGPELKATGKAKPSDRPTPEQRRLMIEGTVAAQFETIGAAAKGCDVIVGATALQIAAPSIAEQLGIPYVFAAYCPAVLPSSHHAPPVLVTRGDSPSPPTEDKRTLWARDAERWNETWRDLINRRRSALRLAPIDDVRRYVLTDRPWLAADATLAPWPELDDRSVYQTGAWLIRDERPLSPELEAFLDAGDPPIYFGFGSARSPENASRAMIEAARALGRRAILLRGWADLSAIDDAPDCIAIGEVNQEHLFTRVAAVVHHGGAGTTTAATRAGGPQVVVPQQYDQFYFAARVEQIGIGVAHDGSTPTNESLVSALTRALHECVARRAADVAMHVRTDGAANAARALIDLVGSAPHR